MSLANGNITPRLARTEMGSEGSGLPTNDLAVHDVCRRAGQNQFSFYGPWKIDPDGVKSASISYGTSDDRLGDFRQYNHSANTPYPSGNLDLTYDPGETTLDTVLPAYPVEMNILNALDGYSSSALRLCYKMYSNSTRTTLISGTNTFYGTISWYTPTLSTSHIRTQTQRALSTQIPLITGITTSYSTLYVDCYISNTSGTRLLNLGTSVAAGYFTITMTENEDPYVNGGAAPSGAYTGLHGATSDDNGRCSEEQVIMTVGSTDYTFYLRIIGFIEGSYSVAATSCTIQLVHKNSSGGTRQTLTLGTNITLPGNAPIQISSLGSYPDLDNTWGYGDYALINITSCTYGSGYAC